MGLSGKLSRFQGKKIAVLMGGLSSEREISIRSGENVFQALVRLGLNAICIDCGRNLPDQLKEEKVDAAFIVLHGSLGEDGAVQGLLEWMNIPYTGCGILGSALGMNKKITKKVFQAGGIPVPGFVSFEDKNDKSIIADIEKNLGFPVVLKANSEGSSIGVVLIQDKKELEQKLPGFLKEYPGSFAEQYIKGREITVGLVGSHTSVQVLPILELKPKHEFYDFEAKYTAGMTDFEIPAKLKPESLKRIEKYCTQAYRDLHLSGVVRIDAMLDQDENPYFLEANTVPGMTATSDIPAMAKAAGMTFDEIVSVILENIQFPG